MIPKVQSKSLYRRRINNTMTKRQMDKQGSTKHYIHCTQLKIEHDEPLTTGVELRCSGGVISSCSASGIHRVTLVTHPAISHEWGKDLEVLTRSGTYPWYFVTQIFHSGQPSHGDDRKTFEVMTST